MSLPNGCTRIAGKLDHDGRCRMSDLRPEDCGLPCHRDCEPVPAVDLLDDRLAA